MAVLFAIFQLSFLGRFGVFANPPIPWPYDTIIALVIGAMIHVYVAGSAFMTLDLKYAIERLAQSPQQ